MRNLKRALSLALSAAMLLGMMVTGAGASHSDVTSKHNQEAIAVVSAAGIMGAGDTFNPDGGLTRGELAVVITNLMGWNPKQYESTGKTFADAGWAAGYVGAMYANGLTSGVGNDAKGNPLYGLNTPVTTETAALMLLKAIGYFQFDGDFSAVWSDTVRDIMTTASRVGLMKDVDAATGTTVTRNQLAQMVLNALETPMVEGEEEGGTNITINGMTITQGGKTTYTEIDYDDDDYANSKDKDEIAKQYLIEKLFGEDFTRDTKEDDMGRTSDVWLDEDGEVIWSVSSEADYVLKCEEDGQILYDLLDEENLLKKMDNEDDFKDENLYKLFKGDVIELYIDEDDEAEAVIYSYIALEIESVEECDEDDDEEWIEAGAEYILEIDGDEYYDIQLKGFNKKTYVEGAYVVFVTTNYSSPAEALEEVNDGDPVYETYLADTKTDKIDSVSAGKEYVTIDSKKYYMMYPDALKALDKIEPGNEWTLILDAEGGVMDAVAGEKAVASLDDMYLLAETYTDTNKWGETSTFAVLVDLNGKITEVEVASLGGCKKGELVVVEENSDKDDVLASWDHDEADYNVVKNAVTDLEKDQTRLSSYRLNNKTDYVIITGDKGDVDGKVITGGVNYHNVSCTNYLITEKGDRSVLYVVLYDPNETLTEGTAVADDLIYIYDTKDIETGIDCYLVPIVTESGKETTAEISEKSWEKNKKVGWYAYSKDKDGYYDIDPVTVKPTNKNGEWSGNGGVFTDLKLDKASLFYTDTTADLGGVIDIDLDKDLEFVDLDDKDSGYKKSVGSLEKLFELLEEREDEATIQVLVKEDDGVVLVILTDY